MTRARPDHRLGTVLAAILIDAGTATAASSRPPASSVCEPSFCVDWVEDGADAPASWDSNAGDVPDWIDETVAALGEVFATQGDELGFPAPKSDESSEERAARRRWSASSSRRSSTRTST